MKQAKISIIIPTLNRKELLAETLQSVLLQTSPEWQAIVVDDGSADGSGDFTRSLSESDPRIKFISRDRFPKGAATCRNIGLQHADHDFVIFLDSDDLMEPYCIENRLKALEAHPGSDFLVFQIASFSSSAARPEYFWNIDNHDDDTSRFIRLDAVWQTSSVLWRKESVMTLGGFDEKLHCWQDVDIHLRALMAGFKYKKFLDSKPDVLYRRHNQFSISQQQIHSREKLQSRNEILSKTYLMAAGRPQIISEMRWMAAAIIASAASGHHFKDAREILLNAWNRKILDNRNMFDLVKLLLVVQFRMERISTGKKIKQRISDRIIWKNSICTIPVTPY